MGFIILTEVSEVHGVSVIRAMMEAANTPETSFHVYKTSLANIHEAAIFIIAVGKT